MKIVVALLLRPEFDDSALKPAPVSKISTPK